MKPTMSKRKNFAEYTDQELIDGLMALPVQEDLHTYFFSVVFKSVLSYNAMAFKDWEPNELLGEFYEFVSKDNWYVLRNYKGIGSLRSYLSVCFQRHVNRLRGYWEIPFDIVSLDYINEHEEEYNLYAEPEEKSMPVEQALLQLKERDRLVIQEIFYNGKSALEAAEVLWVYVRSNEKDWRKLPSKTVQNTISSLKLRALAALQAKLLKENNSDS